ncbi:hypothetical protein PsYK624_004250 [Phanerochaete sordida]|uniref:Uncharacterized protein n=1 Tax=Phanerochaete sordida TaxID=48140 RepID=A0A9P3FY55_9APHY|nr:hypothetical protein PsYK624_004250 [Phanerochaete sordida]
MDMEVGQQVGDPPHASEDARNTVGEQTSHAQDGGHHRVSDNEVYSNVMRVLSQTMNASLAELGYFPSLGAMAQELRKENRDFHDMTLKLHADNRTLQRTIEGHEQHLRNLAAELDAYKRECRRLGERLHHALAERDHFAQLTRMIQNGMANAQQHIPLQMMPPPPQFVPAGPVLANGMPEPNPDFSFHMAQPGAMPAPTIQGYHGPEAGMQASRGMTRQVMTTAIVPSNASSRSNSRPNSRPASRRGSESVVSNAQGRGSAEPRTNGLGTIRITPPTSAGGQHTIRIAPASALAASHPAAPSASMSASASAFETRRSPSVADLTAADGAALDEEPTRKRRRVTLTLREPSSAPAPPAPAPEREPKHEPPLDLTPLNDELRQLAQSIASPQPVAAALPPAPAPASLSAAAQDEQTDEDDDDRDADGLVRVDMCVKIAFEEKEGRMWCKMCRFRNTKEVTDQPPEAMSTTETADLAKHLEEVHPAGWKRLRGIS